MRHVRRNSDDGVHTVCGVDVGWGLGWKVRGGHDIARSASARAIAERPGFTSRPAHTSTRLTDIAAAFHGIIRTSAGSGAGALILVHAGPFGRGPARRHCASAVILCVNKTLLRLYGVRGSQTPARAANNQQGMRSVGWPGAGSRMYVRWCVSNGVACGVCARGGPPSRQCSIAVAGPQKSLTRPWWRSHCCVGAIGGAVGAAGATGCHGDVCCVTRSHAQCSTPHLTSVGSGQLPDLV